MEIVKLITMALGGLIVLVGIFSLVAAWFAPSVLATPFMRWMVTGRKLAPTRANQTLMSIWSILLGTYIVVSLSGYLVVGIIVFFLWLPFGVMVLRRTFWSVDKA